MDAWPKIHRRRLHCTRLSSLSLPLLARSLTDGVGRCVAQYTRRQWLATPNTTRRTAIGTIFQGQSA
eukprot:COSAG04_NODE_28229_length_277_cov_0.578652_1_plen_66_part_10